MTSFKRFEDVEAWQKARLLTREIYMASRTGHFSRDYGLCNQIQRAAVSTMTNIAEGFERDGNNEFKQFLSISKGSVGEVRSLLYIALDNEYISKEDFSRLTSLAIEISRLVNGLIRYFESSDFKGRKFNNN